MKVRIGTVSYLNARPLVSRIDTSTYELIQDHPSVIARMLRDGDVDLALVPVASALADGDFRIVPGFCIGAMGPVDSVLIVAETPPEQWTRLALDGVSRSSVALARVLLAGPLKGRVRPDLVVEDVAAGTGVDVARGTVASVVIGDVARDLPARLTHRLDLAAEWTTWTGLPFVFAVWAGRPDLDPAVIQQVRDAGHLGLAAVPVEYEGADKLYLTERIRYALDEQALMGLRRFAALAKRLGLVNVEEPQLYGPARRIVDRAVDLDTLLAKGADGERLSFDEGVRLDREARISDLGTAADLRKQALHPSNIFTSIISRNIN